MEIVRKKIVKHGVLAIGPLSVDDIAVSEHIKKIRTVAVGPGFEELKLPLSGSAAEVMATTLQLEIAVAVEADGAVGSVELLFYDHGTAGEKL